jgi:phenylalanyl-tRNA synthetase alpha subunit
LSNISCSHRLELAGTGWSWLEPAGAGWNLDLTAKFSLQGSLMAVATAEITQNRQYKNKFICYFKVYCTDKKDNQIFPIYKEIQNGAVAKSYITNSLLIYGEIFAHFLTY